MEYNNYYNSQNMQTVNSHVANVNSSLRKVSELPPLYQSIFSEFQYFNSIQSHLMDDLLLDDSSIVVSAPTGSGKTTLFELAILRLLNACHLDEESLLNNKIVYMAPVKALCTERYNDWERKLLPLGLKAIEVTGDSDEGNLLAIQHFNLVLTTPEKWDSLTRKWRDHSSLISVIKLFLIDEVHLLNEDKRGSTLEAVVSRMKTVQEYNSCSSYIRFVAVSATIPNIEDVAVWLGKKSRPAKFGEEARPVKLRKIVKSFPFGQSMSYFKFDFNLSYKLRQVILEYSEGKPTLIFCSTRKSVVQTSSILLQTVTFHFTPAQKLTLEEARQRLQDAKLKDLLRHGVGFHHAGLIASDRHIVEELFRSGFLPVLICTSTLAMGVNLPAHLVIIKSTAQYSNGAWEEYSEGQVLQMMGRAGRPQFDSNATAVILTKSTMKERYEKLLLGNQMVESNLHKNLAEHLNSEIVLGTITDIAVALQWLRSTFFYVRALKNPRYYGIPLGLSLPEQEARLQAMCMRELNGLEKYELVKKTDFAYNVEPTENGKLMARLYIAFETMKNFMKIKGTENLPELLEILCSCQEFIDIKLRVNEKAALNLLNNNKHQETIRFPLQGRIKSREMKINCLLQAVLGCLPINDHSLSQEGNRILRLAERVTKAVSLYLWQKNYYQALASALTLAKCLSAKMWENSIYLSRHLPGIGPALASLLAAAKKVTFQAIINSNPRDLERILNKHPPLGNNLQEAAKSIPQYSISVNYGECMRKVHVTIKLLNAEYVHDTSRTSNLLIADNSNNLLRKEKLRDGTLIECSKGYTSSVYVPEGVNCIVVHLINDSFVGVDIRKKIALSSKECFELVSGSSVSFEDSDCQIVKPDVVGSSKKQTVTINKQNEKNSIKPNNSANKKNKIHSTKSQTNLHQYAFKPSKKLNHTQDETPDWSEVEVSSTQDKFPESYNVPNRSQNSNIQPKNKIYSNDSQTANHIQSVASTETDEYIDPAKRKSCRPQLVDIHTNKENSSSFLNQKEWNYVDNQTSDRYFKTSSSRQSDFTKEKKTSEKCLIQTNLNNFRKQEGFPSADLNQSNGQFIYSNCSMSATKVMTPNVNSTIKKLNNELPPSENSHSSNIMKEKSEFRKPLIVSPNKLFLKNNKREFYSSSSIKLIPLFLPLSSSKEADNDVSNPDSITISEAETPNSAQLEYKQNQDLPEEELQKTDSREKAVSEEMDCRVSKQISAEEVNDKIEDKEDQKSIENKKVSFSNEVYIVRPGLPREVNSCKISNIVSSNNMEPAKNQSETIMNEERTETNDSKLENKNLKNIQSNEPKSIESKKEEDLQNTSFDSWLDSLDESDNSILEVDGVKLTKNGVSGFENVKVNQKGSTSPFEVDDLFGNSPENKQRESNNSSSVKENNTTDLNNQENKSSCYAEQMGTKKRTFDFSNFRKPCDSNQNLIYQSATINEQRNQAEVHINIPVTVHLSENNVFKNNATEEMHSVPKLLRNDYGDPFAPIHQPLQPDRPIKDRMSKPSFQNISHLTSQNYVESEYFQTEAFRGSYIFQNSQPNVSAFAERNTSQNKTKFSVNNESFTCKNNLNPSANVFPKNSKKTYFPESKNFQKNTLQFYNDQESIQNSNYKQESSEKFQVLSNCSTQDIESYRKSMLGNTLFTPKGSKAKRTKNEVGWSPRLSNLVQGSRSVDFNTNPSQATAIRPPSQSQHSERHVELMHPSQNNPVFVPSQPYFTVQDQQNKGPFAKPQNFARHQNFGSRGLNTSFGIPSRSSAFRPLRQSLHKAQNFEFSNLTQASPFNSPQFNQFTTSNYRQCYGFNQQQMLPMPWDPQAGFQKASQLFQAPQIFNPHPVSIVNYDIPPEEEYINEERDSDGLAEEEMNTPEFAFNHPDFSPSPPLSGEYFEKVLNNEMFPNQQEENDSMSCEETSFL